MLLPLFLRMLLQMLLRYELLRAHPKNSQIQPGGGRTQPGNPLLRRAALYARHPKTTIIWAHLGLGRIVHPVQVSAEAAERPPTQFEIVQAMLEDPALAHVSFDISWDEVAKYAVATPQSISRVAAVLNRYPDRFLFGTDTVAPATPEPYFAVFDMWAPVWKQLTPDASLKVRKGNYERLFDAARRRVRAWEKEHVQ